jgi:APA family basic amino acid/polyamine antiporter
MQKSEAGPPLAAKDAKIVSAAPHFVQGMGLFSATAIVMGSMIGSGIFIVSADMSRTLGSPALLIGAWLVTAAMTIIGALSYGELAAMMPKAGGQYVYLREALGPLWGFLYGWTLFLVIQTGTIAAVGVAFGKFLGVFFPSINQTNWLWHIGHVPAIPVGPMVLGNMDIGLNTANLSAIVIITLLTFTNTLGVKLGAAVQNVFTSAKVLALLGVVFVGLIVRNIGAVAENFGVGWTNFWAGSGWNVLHPVQVGVGGPTALVGALTVLAVVQVGSLFSADAWNNVTFTAGEIRNPKRNLPLSLALGTGVVLLLYICCNFVYLSVLPMSGVATAATIGGRGIMFATQDRVATAVMESAFGRSSRLLRDEPRWAVLQERRQAESEVEYAGELAVGAVGVDVSAMPERKLWTVVGLRDFCGAGVLCVDDCGPVCAAPDAA